VSSSELESHDHDRALLAEIERKAQGFTRYLGNTATIDATFSRWAKEFYKKADTAAFSAAAKKSGTAQANKGTHTGKTPGVKPSRG
jgi:hypothetical protein